MVLLAVVASLLFPGTGQALVCRPKCVVVWGVAGFVPALLALAWAPLLLIPAVIRPVSAVHAGIKVWRAGPQRPNLELAGIAAVVNVVALVALRLLVMEAFVARSSSMQPALDFKDRMLVDKLTPRLTGYERGEIAVFLHPSGSTYVKRLIAVGGDTVEVRDGALRINGVKVTNTPIGPTTYRDFDEVRESWLRRGAVAVRESYAGHSYVILRDPDGDNFNDFPELLASMPPSCDVSAEGWPGEGPVYAQPAMTLAPDGHSCVVPAGSYFFLGDNRDNSNDSRRWGVIPEGKMVGRVVGLWWSDDRGRLGHVD